MYEVQGSLADIFTHPALMGVHVPKMAHRWCDAVEIKLHRLLKSIS